jgi:hypothetical protein
MSKLTAFSVLENKYGLELATKTLDAYKEIEENYFLEKWKPSELDAGHFVECVRRIIEWELCPPHTDFSSKLSNFSDNVLKLYEQKQGNESFRMLIPRTLKSVYNIRNKRGVGHIKDISPNRMDATFILFSVKWVLAEIVRLVSNLSIPETQILVDNIVERKLDIIWKHNGTSRILYNKLVAREQILILLYETSPLSVNSLINSIEYKNKSTFEKILKKMHIERLIEHKNECTLSPKGTLEAELIIKRVKETGK